MWLAGIVDNEISQPTQRTLQQRLYETVEKVQALIYFTSSLSVRLPRVRHPNNQAAPERRSK